MARKKQHPLDALADQLEAEANKPVAEQSISPDYWEISHAADDTVGDYPQADYANAKAIALWGDSQGLGADGFPMAPIPGQKLRAKAKWTDVLSSNLWSEGYLVSDTALAIFKQFDLGDYREYPVTVTKLKVKKNYTYLYFNNQLSTNAIDFTVSEFYLANIIGSPIGPVTIKSFAEWEKMLRLASDGELEGCGRFSRIAYKKLIIKKRQRPKIDVFRLQRLGITMYISTRLKEAISQAGLTGLEIRPNKRLFLPT
jgi:hypothetical protein